MELLQCDAVQLHAESRRDSREGRVMIETLSVSKQNISAITALEVEDLAMRLEQDNYTNAFDGLNDWHLLRAIAFQRPELVEPYIYLLDLDPYDEV
jgi:hypothetical protein